MQPLSFESITVDEIELPILKEKDIRLAILRLDKIHPVISGNKWFKLKYYLDDAVKSDKSNILTFGGAYSNHIVAVSAAGKLFELKTTGIIRGEKPEKLSHTLTQAVEYGMDLIFMTRGDYRNKKLPGELNPEDYYIIYEGGYGINGARGAATILDHCKKDDYSHIVCAVGTSTMMAGLVKACLPEQQVIGISALKNNTTIEKDLCRLLLPPYRNKKFQLEYHYHFGGYAKYNQQLIDFMNNFYRNTIVPSDFVYTGKLFYGVVNMIGSDFFSAGSSVLAIHSGGLQGNLSLPNGTLIF